MTVRPDPEEPIPTLDTVDAVIDDEPNDGGGHGNDSDSRGCPPPVPLSIWASNDPDIMHELNKHGKDINSVKRAINNWTAIKDAANAHNIDPAILAAIGIRESNFNVVSQVGGYGEGVFQIDLGVHSNITKAQADDIAWSANWAANYIYNNMSYLGSKFPALDEDKLLQAAVASYNFGVGNISGNPDTIDVGTTGDDYGANVIGISKAFKHPETQFTPGAGSANGGKDGC